MFSGKSQVICSSTSGVVAKNH